MNTDPISDMLTRIRNASMVKKHQVALPSSKIKFAIAKILEKEGYVFAVAEATEGIRKTLTIGLKYENGLPVIHSIKRLSKPGNRLYVKSTELPVVLSNLGLSIVSTPNGLMTNKEARQRKLGGELICEIF
ncbi:MAG: 30S ribosomal protein S8 [Patescibacteria group bacterium]